VFTLSEWEAQKQVIDKLSAFRDGQSKYTPEGKPWCLVYSAEELLRFAPTFLSLSFRKVMQEKLLQEHSAT